MKCCERCGDLLEDNVKFCTKCGNSKFTCEDGARPSEKYLTTVKMNSKTKKLTVIIVIIILMLIAIVSVFFSPKVTKARNVNSNLKLGNKYLKQHDYKEAILAFNKAIAIDKNNIEAKRGLSKAYVLKGESLNTQLSYKAALDAFNKAIAEDNKNIDAYLKAADVFVNMGERYEGILFLRKGYDRTKDEKLKNKIEELKSNLRGNSINNLINFGYVAKQGEWIYYRNISDNGCIYKMEENGEDEVKLTKKTGTHVNVVDEWVYYLSGEGIFKVKIDGSEEKKIRDINDDKEFILKNLPKTAPGDPFLEGILAEVKNNTRQVYMSNLTVIGNKVYYRVGVDVHFGAYLIETNENGNLNRTLELNPSSTYVAVDEDYAYYWSRFNSINKGPSTKVKLDGSDQGLLFINNSNENYDFDFISNVRFDGTDIYFTSLIPKVTNFKKDKFDKKTTLDFIEDFKAINVLNGYLYYSNATGIYKIKNDGTCKTKLSDKWTDSIAIEGEWLYFVELTDAGKESKLSRIKLDESQITNLATNNIVKENAVISSSKNTLGNIANGSLVVVQGDWSYYASREYGKTGLFKMKSDGTNNTKLTDGDICNINMIGDWIYYIKNYNSINKIKIDGTNESTVKGNIKNYSMQIENEWIYYADVLEKKLCKIKTDGSGFATICNDKIWTMLKDNEWIYCLSSDWNSVFKIKLDGTEKTNIYTGRVERINVLGDWIYCNTYQALFRIKKDGSNKQIFINNEHVDAVNVTENCIYLGRSGDLYRMDLDGKNSTKIIDKAQIYESCISNISVISDYVYYNVTLAECCDGLYKMKIDGTQRKVIWHSK